VFSAGSNLGYTIVSGDDRLPAIIGYTESGDYDNDRLPDNLRNFMQAYQDFAENVTEEQITEIKAWKANSSNVHAAVAPFMQEQWNQTAPYNNMCPEYNYYSTGNIVKSAKAVTGCVATAVAQILHHYSCPSQLKADIPEYTTQVKVNEYLNTLTMPAIAAGDSYDWANMPNQYTGGESTAQNNAVAKLMLHIGCAVQMNYGPSSGANATPETFTKYFGMDKDLVRYCDRNNYQIAQWDAILYEEMANKRPVYYDGQSTGGGHAFVIHGYENGMYYVNWGWGGYCDGYFDITILNPNSNSGAGASTSEDGYGMGNSMIIGIQPDNGIEDDVAQRPVFTSYEFCNDSISDLSKSGTTISFTAKIRVANINSTANTRYVGLGYKNDENIIIPLKLNPQIDNKVQIVGMQNNSFSINGYNGTFSMDVETGKTYNLFIIESEDAKTWIASYGANKTANIKINDNSAILVNTAYNLTATATRNTESGGYAGMSNTIDITVANSGDKEYYDKVYVRVSTSETKPEEDTFVQGITSPIGGSTTFSFAYTPKNAGTYYFWILDSSKKEIGKSSITFNTAETPVLSFVSITCDNTSEDIATGKCSNYNVKTNKVYDTKATFTFKIRNDGGYYEDRFYIFKYTGSTNTIGCSSDNIKTLKIPGNSTTSFTFTLEDNLGETIGCQLECVNQDITIKGLESPNTVAIIDKPGYGLPLPLENMAICYLAGSPKYTRTENTTLGIWNTVCLPFDCDVPSGVTVEEFSRIESDKAIFTPVETMTAGTPYIFKANGYDVNFESTDGKTKEISEIEKTDGTFIGVLSKTITFNSDFKVAGFTYYGINPEANEFQRLDDTATCTPYHAYLKVADDASKTQALKVIHGGGDGTTGISNVTDSEKPQIIYNLNGQRISTPQKGINIINGRKVIIK